MLLSNSSAFFIETIRHHMILTTGIAALTLTLLLMGIIGVVKTRGAIGMVLICMILWHVRTLLEFSSV